MMKKGYFLLLFFFFLFRSSAGDYSLPPLWSVLENPDGGSSIRLLGPLMEYQKGPGKTMIAVRPVASFEETNSGKNDYCAFDFLWPLCTMRDSRYSSMKIVLLYLNLKTREISRNYFFPFFFGIDTPEKGFCWGIFPFYGKLNDFLSYDSTEFILFPLYWNTEKGKQKGFSLLWPFFNLEKSEDFRKVRVFPFYACSERKDRKINRSVLWPFFSEVQYLKHGGSGYLLWPWYGCEQLGDTNSWTVLWPFFSYASRKDGGFRVNAPYPLFRFGKNLSSNHDSILTLWPFFGMRKTDQAEYRYAAWPLVWLLKEHSAKQEADSLWVAPFYWSKKVKDRTGKSLRNFLKLWPFFSYHSRNGMETLRIPDPAAMHTFPVIERNLAPLWTVFQYKKTETELEIDLLWGMFHLGENAGKKIISIPPFCKIISESGKKTQTSILFGLFRFK